MIWFPVFLLSCAASATVVKLGDNSFERVVEESGSSASIEDVTLLAELDSFWNDDKQVEKDFEKKCNYKPIHAGGLPSLLNLHPAVKRYARDSPFNSVWLSRRIYFHTTDSIKKGIHTPGTFAPVSLQWDVTNRVVHHPNSHSESSPGGTASCEGGCTYGAAIDKMTSAQIKGDVLYSMEKLKNFQVNDLYRGQVMEASVDMIEWFAWHGLEGKFALRLTYTEDMLEVGTKPAPAKVGHKRESKKLYCDLYYKPVGGQSGRVEKRFWQVNVQDVKEDGQVKTESLLC